MKKNFIILFFLCFSLIAIAQPNGRVFTIYKKPFQKLTSGTTVSYPLWDDLSATLPLGFNFTLFDSTFNTLYIDSNTISTGAEFRINTSGNTHCIMYSNDLMDRATITGNSPSTIKYQTSGIAGSRIFTAEYLNAGFFNEYDINGTLDDSTDFQLKLYESDKAIEWHFGKSKITDFVMNVDSAVALIFMKNFNDTSMTAPIDSLYIVSSTTPPTLDKFDLATLFTISYTPGLYTYPTDSTVFRFSSVPLSVKGEIALSKDISLYPTIATSTVFVSIAENSNLNKAMLHLYDMNGRMVLQQKLSKGSNAVDVSKLSNANYLVTISTDTEKIAYKICKH